MNQKEKQMVERIMDTEAIGYAYLYPAAGGERKEYLISTTPENLANFVGGHFMDARQMIVTDMLDRLILDTARISPGSASPIWIGARDFKISRQRF